MRLTALALVLLALVSFLPAEASAAYRHVCTFGSNVCFSQEAVGDEECEAYYFAEDRLRFDLIVLSLLVRGYHECPPPTVEDPEREGVQAHAASTFGHAARFDWYEQRDPRACKVGVYLAVPLVTTYEYQTNCPAGGPPNPGWGKLVP